MRCVVLVLMLAPVTVVRAQPVTLEQAIRLGLEHNARVQQYEARLSQRASEERAARGNFLPSLRVEGAYTHLNDPLEIDLDPLRQVMIALEAGNQADLAGLSGVLQGRPPLTPEQRQALVGQASQALDGRLPPFRETLKDQNYPSAALTLVQPVFMGGKLRAAHRAAEAEWEAARAEDERVRDEVVQDVVRAYLNVVMLQEAVVTRRDVLAGVRRHRDRAEKLCREGLIPQSDVRRADVAVADAERNLYDDESRLALAETALRYAAGRPDAPPFVVNDTLRYRPVSDSLGAFLARAAEGQPVLRVLAAKRRAAAQKIAAERADFLPQVALFGRYELFPGELSALEPEWAVGVRAGFTLFSGFQRGHRLQAARGLHEEVRHLEDYTAQQIELLVTQAYRELRRAEQRYVKLEADQALAAENLRMAERRYETGLGTALEVVDAQLVWEKARIDRLQSLHAYYGALNNLYTATGRPQDMLAFWSQTEFAR